MDLLSNAVEAIRIGVEDYKAGTAPRLLAAVRNIHAGILLLYKEALLRRSPEESNDVLIKSRIQPVSQPDGGVKFVGVGKKTVDVYQIRERFEGLGIATDWKRFGAVSDVRNDLEHYYAEITREGLSGLITSAIFIIRTFCVDELGEDPLELFGAGTWTPMLEVAEVYEAEKRECETALTSVNWESEALANGVPKLRCTECGSDLLYPSGAPGSYTDIELTCRACGTARDADSFVPDAISEALDWESYNAAKEGEDSPYVSCPQCGTDSYVVGEQRCALCGDSVEHTCSRCGHEIPASELNSSPLCSWCDHMMSKDD